MIHRYIQFYCFEKFSSVLLLPEFISGTHITSFERIVSGLIYCSEQGSRQLVMNLLIQSINMFLNTCNFV